MVVSGSELHLVRIMEGVEGDGVKSKKCTVCFQIIRQNKNNYRNWNI